MRNYGNYPDLSKVKRILVVKLRHHGDVLLTSPLFLNLKEFIPRAMIDALIYRESSPMLEGHPSIRRLLLYDRIWKKKIFFKRIYYEILFFYAIYREKYDLVINLTEGDRGALAALVSRAAISVGFEPEGKGFWKKHKCYTHLIKNCKTPRHTVEKNLDALRRLGISPPLDKRALYFHIGEKERGEILNLLHEALIFPKDYFVIHPASRWRFKCYPWMGEIIKKLLERGEQVVVTSGGGSQELQLIEAIFQHLPYSRGLLNLSGKTSLKQLGALIENSRCLISIDSVPLHIASALQTPVVAIFGPSSENNWGPWQHRQSRVVTEQISCRPCFMDGCGGSKISDCLYTLTAERILEAVDEMMLIMRSS